MTEQNVHSRIFLIYENVKSVPLHLLFVIHLIPTTWGIQGCWSPDSYLFYNSIFFGLILWSLHEKESEEPILLGLIVNAFAILFDVVVLALYFPGLWDYRNCRNPGDMGKERFSVAMAILNLVIRLFSCSSMYKQWSDRKAALGGFNFTNTKKELSKGNLKFLPIQGVVIGSTNSGSSSDVKPSIPTVSDGQSP